MELLKDKYSGIEFYDKIQREIKCMPEGHPDYKRKSELSLEYDRLSHVYCGKIMSVLGDIKFIPTEDGPEDFRYDYYDVYDASEEVIKEVKKNCQKIVNRGGKRALKANIYIMLHYHTEDYCIREYVKKLERIWEGEEKESIMEVMHDKIRSRLIYDIEDMKKYMELEECYDWYNHKYCCEIMRKIKGPAKGYEVKKDVKRLCQKIKTPIQIWGIEIKRGGKRVLKANIYIMLKYHTQDEEVKERVRQLWRIWEGEKREERRRKEVEAS
jgi:hypothetical protein